MCIWSGKEQSCSLREPPSDVMFVVLVSFATVIISIPLIVVLNMVLEIYCSKWPGEAVDEDRITEALSGTKPKQGARCSKTLKSLESDTVEKRYFGEVVKEGIAADGMTPFQAAIEDAKFAYSGETCCPIVLSCMTCLSSDLFIL